MKYPKSAETKKAYESAGFRERYAMENGNRTTVYINGHKCYKYTYSNTKEYQDANGATYDTVRGSWID
jgi:hypothetical protein